MKGEQISSRVKEIIGKRTEQYNHSGMNYLAPFGCHDFTFLVGLSWQRAMADSGRIYVTD